MPPMTLAARALASARYRTKRLLPRRPDVPTWMARPLTERDLATVPAGWRAGPPDFVGVALPKAGTTWWHGVLLRHPQVEQNRFGHKELHAFTSARWTTGPMSRALYRQAFAAPEGHVCGEWTPTYLSQPVARRQLVAAAPEARFLVLLRDPVERTISHANHLRHRLRALRLRGDRADFLWRHSLLPAAIETGFVAEPLADLLETVGPDRVLVQQFERCRAEPHAAFAELTSFLGLRDGHAPVDVATPVNERPREVSPPTAVERDELAELYAVDTAKVGELVPEVDLDLWPLMATVLS